MGPPEPPLDRSNGMSVKSSDAAATRERLPFKVIDADGHATELAYSSPHPAADHDEQTVLEELPWFDAGQPLHNWMLHETDFYDEVEQIWGRRWGAEGIGKLREVLVSRPTENETRPEYAREGQYYNSAAAGNDDLGPLLAQLDQDAQGLADNGDECNHIN